MPWERNQFRSTRERIATTESLVKVVKELNGEHRARFPRGRKLELITAKAAMVQELDELMALDAADRPVGRPATLRIEIDAIDAELNEHAAGITRADVAIYEAIFGFLCFRNSGRWFPSWERIAAAARTCTRSVGRAMKRFAHHGLLDWISRSRKEAGPPGAPPQRGQTSHAYFLNPKKRMAARVYDRFVQLRERRLKRMTVRTDSPLPQPSPAPVPGDVAALRQSVAALGASVDLRGGHLG